MQRYAEHKNILKFHKNQAVARELKATLVLHSCGEGLLKHPFSVLFFAQDSSYLVPRKELGNKQWAIRYALSPSGGFPQGFVAGESACLPVLGVPVSNARFQALKFQVSELLRV
jgi:hypothetical protein